jgi:AcrR family transcriptional regulator
MEVMGGDDMARNPKLNLAQRRAAEILAGNDQHNMTLAQIADHVGVRERTLYRWKQDKDFVATKTR